MTHKTLYAKKVKTKFKKGEKRNHIKYTEWETEKTKPIQIYPVEIEENEMANLFLVRKVWAVFICF